MATEIEQIERDMPDGSVQKGLAVRDGDKYADNSLAFLDAVNAQQIEVKDGAGNIIQSALTSGGLEDDIAFTGQNMSDSPSNNPAVMSIGYTYLNNGQFSVQVSSNNRADLWIVHNTMDYLSPADIEAKTYRCGVQHLFQGYIMPGVPSDERRSDGTQNAHQILSVF